MTACYPAEVLARLAATLFEAVGSPADEARLTAQDLVTSSLMGHDSHGVLRVPEYLDLVAKGQVVPGGKIIVEATSQAVALVDCGRNFGQVGARQAMQVGIDLARRFRTACVVTRNCAHVGRLGAYVQLAAEQNLVGLATCNSPQHGHFVLPWGARDGRLATNPIAYAVPTGGDPIVADFSTSVAPEGKIRYYRNAGQSLPVGWILDASGNPSTDPADFYGPPRGGILPLGGSAGHKGYALGLLVEILGSALAGVASTDPAVIGNGVCFWVLDPTAFCPREVFLGLMAGLVAYIKSARPAPGVDEVLLPGEVEFRSLRRRAQEGVPMDPVTRQAIQAHAARLGATIAWS